MSESQTDTSWVRLYVLPAVAVLASLAGLVWLLDLAPPDRVTFAAGRPGGAYHALAERYRDILIRDGIEVEILETPGSVANVEALTRTESPVDVAFLQGGVNPPAGAPLEALAATFLEPLWIFHDGALDEPANPARWSGLAIAAGEPGSGTRFVVEAALRALGLDPARLDLIAMNSAAATDALLAGEIDVALFVAPVTAPYLQPLFADADVRPASIRDGEALVRRLPFVELTDIPPSSFDYAGRLPRRRIELVAMVGRLVAQSDLHPALVDRLVEAAREIHSGRDLITDENQFPSVIGANMPVNAQAATLISQGPSPINRFLPYWVAAQISSFALLLLSLVVILFPIFRIAPGLYRWRMRAKVWRHYSDLRRIDNQSLEATDPAELSAMQSRLDAIEYELVSLKLPPAYREYAYAMRVHLDLVHRKITERRTRAL